MNNDSSNLLKVRQDGTIKLWQVLDSKKNKLDIPFSMNSSIGPSWHVDDKAINLTIDTTGQTYSSMVKGINYSLTYSSGDDQLDIYATISNTNKTSFQPYRCSLKLGIDTYMEKYANWLHQFFPTFMRCEKTHFYGYLMSPSESILSLCSDTPIASWHLDHNVFETDEGHLYGGHRINTLNLDFIQAGKLPDRHPHNLIELKPNERRKWHIILKYVPSLDLLPKTLSQNTNAPFIHLTQTHTQKKSPLKAYLYSRTPCTIEVISPPDGQKSSVISQLDDENCCELNLATDTPGLYKIIATSKNHKISEASYTVHKAYSWYMDKAAKAALLHLPRATTNCESYYGFYTLYEHLLIDKSNKHYHTTEKLFDTIYPLIFDDNKATVIEHRIQNSATMVNLLTLRYQATNTLAHLQKASRLALWLIKSYQKKNGAFYNGHKHYTSVIYPTKNLLFLSEVIENLLTKDKSLTTNEKKAMEKKLTTHCFLQ